MKQSIIAVALAIAFSTISTHGIAQAHGNPSMTNAGNALQVLLPLAAYASTLYMDDWDGAKQYSKALAVNMLTVEVLKKTTREWRPDHSNQLSFPSGHAAVAFSAGAFVRQRYGVAYALPLYTLGAYTAYSRVKAKKHYWHDVAGSLVVAELSQHIFSTTYEKTSLNVALTGGGRGTTHPQSQLVNPPQH